MPTSDAGSGRDGRTSLFHEALQFEEPCIPLPQTLSGNTKSAMRNEKILCAYGAKHTPNNRFFCKTKMSEFSTFLGVKGTRQLHKTVLPEMMLLSLHAWFGGKSTRN